MSTKNNNELEGGNCPPCFTQEQWVQWLDALRVSTKSTPAKVGMAGMIPNSYCTDCTESYQRKMCSQDRCNFPAVTFERSAHGFIEGVRPAEHQLRPAPKGEKS